MRTHRHVSAQCPSCGLHELIPIVLARLDEGRWKQAERSDFVHAQPAPDRDRAELDHVEIDACPVCNGAWFDEGELDELAGEHAGIEQFFAPDSTAGTRPCPRGHGPMREHRLPGAISTPLDRCDRCGGVWLDGQERRKLAKVTTRDGQQSIKERWVKRGAIWAAQLLTQMPVEVENPTRGTPWVVFAILATLLVCFLLQIQGFIDTHAYGVVADRVAHGGTSYTLFTHQWLHGSWVHLLGNAYFLYTFGDNIEHIFGRRRFIAFYVTAGLMGAMLHVVSSHATALPVVGASGAIAGVLAAYLWTFPRGKLLHVVFFVQLELPVWAYLLVWVGFHFVYAFKTFDTHVAWFAHLGGFAFGAAVTPLLLRRRRAEVARRVAVAAVPGRT